MAPVDLHPSRYGAPEALTGVILPDFDGRLTDWSAVAFESEPPPFEFAPVEDLFLRVGFMVLLAAPWAYVGGLLRLVVG